MITLTIVRHGESTDNLKPLWAGWSDAPLSVHGMNQAKALGESFKTTKIHHIFASDLLRANWTAQQIHRNQPEPKCQLISSDLLREQNFGDAERKPFGEKGGWQRKPGRSFKFENGESPNDVRDRANQAIKRFIEPILAECHEAPAQNRHVVVVAHGIFNAEFLGALLARRRDHKPLEWGYKGMTNTGWTRAEIGYIDEFSRAPTPANISTDPSGPVSPSSSPASPPPLEEDDDLLPGLTMRILCTDVTKHLEGVHRQKGGIGSTGFDDKQGDIRKFFGGGGGGDKT
ncbi:uncharacterized protein I303_100740 [Kwoniella dejecticola CBS 10117]|uniref:Phosphoglycerate mutase n=1 Tax=Kwoniella dejecticola CBS 10117 TaxID=1296121 RepID=A0A1A6AFT0_9TREE|nr:uncharacterized protein I303_00743 [Kwoniella dejecticola CBS 10117]OBR88925.1 hypothetical protein I303_00743 [Kwoniella dejecticola CBS 10117]